MWLTNKGVNDMGCDIHMYVEKKIDGQWQALQGVDALSLSYAVNRLREACECEVSAYWEERVKELSEKTYKFLYTDRNYDLFGMLADVRNGTGFAGCGTGDGFVPISQPRGLPNDVSEYVKGESDEWGGDGHSHSWLTVKDLVDYDWTQKTNKFGYVTSSEYARYLRCGAPNSWCGGVGGPGVAVIANEDMYLRAMSETQEDDGLHYYTQIKWPVTYSEAVEEFYTWSLPKLKELASDALEDVRIVFWFDN